MSEPAVTIYQRMQNGTVREQVSGVTIRRDDTPADPDATAVWLVETGPGFAPPGFKPRAGDRLRDAAREWWQVVEVTGPDDKGVCRLDCTREGGA